MGDPSTPDVRYCPGCGRLTRDPLGPGQVCPACEAGRPWRASPGDPPPRLAITWQDIDRAVARRRGEAWKVLSAAAIARYGCAVVAAGCAALSVAWALDLVSGIPIGDLGSMLEGVRDLARPATLAGCLALLAGAAGLWSVARTRFHRSKVLAVLLLAAVLGGSGAGFVGGMYWVGSLAFSLEHTRMPARAPAGTFDAAAERVMAATVVLFAPDEDGDALKSAIGTGTVVGRGQGTAIVLTCSHVAMPYDSPAAWRDPATAQRVWVAFADGGGAWGRVVWTAPPPVDLVLVEAADAATPEPVEVSPDAGRVVAGDAVFFVPNPYRHGWLAPGGKVLARQEHDTPANRYNLLITDLQVEPGDSGSGLFDEAGRLIGVNTWRERRLEGTRAISLPSDALANVPFPMRAPQGGQE